MSAVKRLAVFDLDGTLVDSARVVASILNELRDEIGKEAKDVNFFIPWLSLGGEDLVANGLEIDPKQAGRFLEAFRLRYVERPTSKDTVYPGVEELLCKLETVGIQMCICTNKPRNLAEKVLEETGLKKYFSFMCAGGDLETKKPNPRNLEVCIRNFSEKPCHAILIGDSLVDQNAARSLGVDFAFFEAGYNDGVNLGEVKFSFKKHSEIIELFLIKG